MKNFLIFLILFVFIFSMVGTLTAVNAKKKIEYDGGGKGKVVFDGAVHSNWHFVCKNCHPKPFKMKKGSVKITMKDMDAGENCGKCHNGKDAFSSKDKKSCSRCHK